MSHYFFDSSALLKRYVVEVGTNWINTLFVPLNTISISRITSVEVVSGVMRRKREGTILPLEAQAIQMLLNYEILKHYRVVGVTLSLTQRAESLLAQYALRAYDAVQLASALLVQQHLTQNQQMLLTFLSADQRLLTIAAQEGLLTDDPNAHP